MPRRQEPRLPQFLRQIRALRLIISYPASTFGSSDLRGFRLSLASCMAAYYTCFPGRVSAAWKTQKNRFGTRYSGLSSLRRASCSSTTLTRTSSRMVSILMRSLTASAARDAPPSPSYEPEKNHSQQHCRNHPPRARWCWRCAPPVGQQRERQQFRSEERRVG